MASLSMLLLHNGKKSDVQLSRLKSMPEIKTACVIKSLKLECQDHSFLELVLNQCIILVLLVSWDLLSVVVFLLKAIPLNLLCNVDNNGVLDNPVCQLDLVNNPLMPTYMVFLNRACSMATILHLLCSNNKWLWVAEFLLNKLDQLDPFQPPMVLNLKLNDQEALAERQTVHTLPCLI